MGGREKETQPCLGPLRVKKVSCSLVVSTQGRMNCTPVLLLTGVSLLGGVPRYRAKYFLCALGLEQLCIHSVGIFACGRLVFRGRILLK